MPCGARLVRDDVLRELIYTNREFSGAEAQGLGLATHVDENPLERARAIAREIAGRNRRRSVPQSGCRPA